MGNGPKFLRTTDITRPVFDWNDVPYCEQIPEDEKRYQLHNGDILISRAGSVGAAFVVKKPPRAIFASYLIRFQPKEELNPFYACFFLKSNIFKKQLTGSTSGTTLQGINASNLAKIKIPLPPLPVQHRIVEILEQADALRHLRAQADAETQKLLQSVFYEMFGDPVRNEKGWEVKKLNNISEIVSGITKGRELKEQNTKFVPYLRVANVQDGFLDLSEIKEIEVLDYEIEKYKLKKGDILLTEGGDRDKLGRGYVWNLEIPVCIHQNHIFRVRLNAKFLNPEFLSFLIGSNYGKRYFAKSAKQTTGIASINSTQLKNFPVLLPPIALQQQFSYMVQEVEQLRMKQSIIRLEVGKMYNGLIQQAFIGELTSL